MTGRNLNNLYICSKIQDTDIGKGNLFHIDATVIKQKKLKEPKATFFNTCINSNNIYK